MKSMIRIVSSVLCLLVLITALGVWVISRATQSQTRNNCDPTTAIEQVSYRDFQPSRLTVTRPCNDTPDSPYVVFVSYLGLTDGDYYTGRDPEKALLTPRDSPHFLHRYLATNLAQHGVASVRYDPLGVRSRPREDGAFSGATVSQDDLMRLERSDFAGLLESVISRADPTLGRSRSAPVILVGHSGAAFTVGDYLNALEPDHAASASRRRFGFVGLSPALSDATGIQQTHRHYWTRLLRNCLRDSPAPTCRERVQSDPFFSRMLRDPALQQRIDSLLSQPLPPDERLQRLDAELLRFASALEDRERSTTSGVAVIGQHHRIRQQVFHTLMFRTPSAGPISCKVSAAALFFGDQDFVLDAEHEASAWTSTCGRRDDIAILPGRGHLLGADPYQGPPDLQALEAVTRGVVAVAARLAASGPPPPSAGTRGVTTSSTR
jgi:hypothetical protein